MNLKEAYEKMLEGKKIKRKGHSICCVYDSKENKICTGDGVAVTGIAFEAALADDWEVVEEPKSKVWKPKPQEMYYFLAGDGSPTAKHNLDDGSVEKFISIGNCFKTGEETKHMVEKLKVIKELRDFALENNEGEIDWNDTKQYKCFLIYDTDDKKICVDYRTYVKNEPFNIYFTSFNLARQAIKTIGEYRIKKYYFDIEE